mmetsp:Transcript_12396/g.35461  ORF Transcript_12396/g.35461 Transcript_12396/m.35461 type:complete len:209 (-) Transcript_12396:156-782(-)
MRNRFFRFSFFSGSGPLLEYDACGALTVFVLLCSRCFGSLWNVLDNSDGSDNPSVSRDFCVRSLATRITGGLPRGPSATPLKVAGGLGVADTRNSRYSCRMASKSGGSMSSTQALTIWEMTVVDMPRGKRMCWLEGRSESSRPKLGASLNEVWRLAATSVDLVAMPSERQRDVCRSDFPCCSPAESPAGSVISLPYSPIPSGEGASWP